MSSIFFSDVHLRDADSVKTKLVIRFIQEVASRFDSVFILGDLFDVWPGTTPFLVQAYRPVLDSIKELVQDGHQVHYLEGNHDFRLGEYFERELGVRVHPNSFEVSLGGKRVYMAHGDLGNPKELGYRALRRFLRWEPLHLALKTVPQGWIYEIGRKSSQLSRDYQKRSALTSKREAAIRQVYRQTAEKLFMKGYDMVLMGHTHLPDDVSATVEGRQCRYINLGDWVRHFTYLEFDGANFYTRSHPVTTE